MKKAAFGFRPEDSEQEQAMGQHVNTRANTTNLLQHLMKRHQVMFDSLLM